MFHSFAISSAEMPWFTIGQRAAIFVVQTREAVDAEVRAHRDARHRLDARGNDDVEVAGLDRGCRVERGLHRRTTLAVDRRRGDGLRPPRDECGDAAHVERLLADLGDATHLDVLDLGGVDADPADEAVEHVRGEVVGPNGGERTVPAADR